MEPFARTPAADRLPVRLRDRPGVLDAALAVLLLLIGAISRPTLSFATGPHTVYTLVVLGCTAAVVLRRMLPRLTLAVTAVLLLVHLFPAGDPGVFAAVICVLAAYTTQTQLAPPWRWFYLLTVYGGAVTAVLVSPLPSADVGPRDRAVAAGVVLAVLTVAVLAGVVRRQRRTRYTLAVERARELEARQGVERRLAAVQERTRIAREMHDILGHSLNAIAAQSEGVRHILRTDTGRADQALADIGQLSRRAVDDVRDLIDVLRTDEDGRTAPETAMRPTPALRDVPDLIASLRYTRAPVRLRVDGELGLVPGQVGLAAYRIVQEGLTNALKHADGAPITVRLDVEHRQVRVTVLNSRAANGRCPDAAEGGRGIVGMEERARALGGSVDTGPDPSTGGWRVTAVLPWTRS
ncbi:sensor histidine kinase [Streptomyces sp. NPDC058045]|uniref:sensor histidine kinase n=1 Tax=Streptomyces sp. NPDC058045 TaxID=3346311 RepID=UPI0036EFF5FB